MNRKGCVPFPIDPASGSLRPEDAARERRGAATAVGAEAIRLSPPKERYALGQVAHLPLPRNLQHGKLARTGTEREGLVDPCQLGFGQAQVPGARVFLGVLGARSLG